MSLSGIESGRAEKAFKFVSEVAKKNDIKDDYRAHIKNFPMMIKTNGLGATLAFAYSKKTSDYIVILEQISEWLSEKGYIESKIKKDYTKMIEDIISKNSSDYRATTIEVMSLLSWLKRFSTGMIEAKNNDK